jgi:hypothetical protein
MRTPPTRTPMSPSVAANGSALGAAVAKHTCVLLQTGAHRRRACRRARASRLPAAQRSRRALTHAEQHAALHTARKQVVGAYANEA